MTQTKKITTNPLNKLWVAILVFVGVTSLLGFLSSVGGGYMTNYLSFKRPPFSALPICYFVTRMLAYVSIGIALLLVYREPTRKKYNRTIDVVCFYSQLLFYFFFPLFFFRLELLIFSTVLIGIGIVLAIITVVRFWANNWIAGLIYTLYTLWLMYLFYVALGCALLA